MSSSLFVPTVAGLWWKKANRAGGVGAVVSGAVFYVLVQFGVIDLGLPPVVVALCASSTDPRARGCTTHTSWQVGWTKRWGPNNSGHLAGTRRYSGELMGCDGLISLARSNGE
jgi:hypothetical protein